MSVVFFHIPRTGGSTIWHSLVKAAAKRGLWIGDLYSQSVQTYGDQFRAHDVLATIHGQLAAMNIPQSSPNVLYHHHTRQNITSQLPAGQNFYVTAVRDPVERFVSEVFHLRKALLDDRGRPREAGKPGAAESMRGEHFYGTEFFNMLGSESVGTDELIQQVLKENLFSDYYINYFFSLLRGSVNNTESGYGGDTRLIFSVLMEEVREKFSYIGIYPFLDRSIAAICSLGGFSDNQVGNELVHIDNASGKPALMASTLADLRDYFSLDYQFLRGIVGSDAHPRG
jgi:hypothetical protein